MIHKKVFFTSLAIICFTVFVGLLINNFGLKQYPNPSFQLLNGNRTSLQDYRGKPVVILFWATTCSICVQELPHLKDFYNEFTNNEFELIAVAMPYDPPNRVVETVERMEISFPVAIDIDGQTINVFGDILLTPTTVIISPDGKVISIDSGKVDIEEIRKVVLQYNPVRNYNSA